MSAEAWVVLTGSIEGDRVTAFAPLVGGIGDPTTESTAHVEGGIGITTTDSAGGVIRWSRVLTDGFTPLAFARSEALRQGVAQSLTVLGATPPTSPLARVVAGQGDTTTNVTVYQGFDGDILASGEDDGVATSTSDADGAVPELDEVLDELVATPPMWTYHPIHVEDIPGWMGWQTGEGGDEPSNHCLEATFYSEQLPKRRDVALRVCLAVGLGLVLYSGSSAPPGGQRVYYGFSTDGRTARSVLNELFLDSQCRWWVRDGILHIDGRVYTGTTLTGALAANNLDDLNSSVISWQDTPPANPDADPEPVLEDYLQECGPTDPGAHMEEAADGSWTYTTSGGIGDDYFEVERTIVKAGGRVVSTTEIERGWRVVQKDADGNVILRIFGTVSTTTKTYDYDPMCPQALRGTDEEVWRYPGMDDVQGAPVEEGEGEGEGDTTPVWRRTDEQAWYNAMPKPYLEQRKTMRQAWSGEGWLARRQEVTRRHTAWAFIKTPHPILDDQFSYQVIGLYKGESRDEHFTPVGGGMWHIHTSDRLTEMKTVISNPDPDLPNDTEVTDVTTTGAVHNYTVITDQAPPSVSCGGECPDVNDCATLGEDRFEFDHATWAARQLNMRQRREYRFQFRHWRDSWKVGDSLSGGVVASLQHAWRDGAPAVTEMQLWMYH